MKKQFLQLGATFMLIGVAFGAMGAHSLKGKIPAESLAVWHTGALYELVHGIAILFVSLLPDIRESRWAGRLFSAGILLFSGSLYVLAITDQKWIGLITPFGGLCFLAGWFLLAISAGKLSNL